MSSACIEQNGVGKLVQCDHGINFTCQNFFASRKCYLKVLVTSTVIKKKLKFFSILMQLFTQQN